SSDHGTRSFCPHCGTTLTFQSSRYPQEIDITTCSLDDPEQVPPKDHIYTSTQLQWVQLADGLPSFPGSRSDV
ncbi:MAG TPA: GFA family protein, partial [Variovorax sp.]|nr:GFA family protein [Variovorax sp.]